MPEESNDIPAPGLSLPTHALPHEVISCSQAAAAKGISLANELKTLIVTTSRQNYALHLPGDKHASLRKVKTFLNVEQAFLLSREKLLEMGLVPGTVSPIIEPVWSLPHLISKNVLLLQFVSTNNGTRSKYFNFQPQLLLQARSFSVGDFEA
jgi:prolyl-tRNA editing enzyme YbaK/EbsC (Cys-tRNA(Pro) deacylase)